MTFARRIISSSNKISDYSGKLISFLILPIFCLPTYEVIVKRYLLNRPTLWTQEFTLSLFAVYFLIGGAYTLKVKGFVAMDLLYNRLDGKKKFFLDAVILLTIIVFCGILIFYGSIWAWEALETGERSGSLWNPIVWPVRIMIPLSAALVILQAVSNFFEARCDKGHESVTETLPLGSEKEM